MSDTVLTILWCAVWLLGGLLIVGIQAGMWWTEREHDKWTRDFERRCKEDDDAWARACKEWKRECDAWDKWKRDFDERCRKDRGES